MIAQVVYADAPALKIGSRSYRSESYTAAFSAAAAKLTLLRCAAPDTHRTMTSREGFTSGRI